MSTPDQTGAAAPPSRAHARGPQHNRADSAARAERAWALRASGHTWAEVAEAEGFRSRGSAQTAVERWLHRAKPETAEAVRRSASEALRVVRVRLAQRFTEAADAGDDMAAAKLAGELRANVDTWARLFGAFAPARAEVAVGLTAEEFGQQAAELLRTVGADPVAQLAAGGGRPLAQLPPLPLVIDADRGEPDHDAEPWSNVGVGYLPAPVPKPPPDWWGRCPPAPQPERRPAASSAAGPAAETAQDTDDPAAGTLGPGQDTDAGPQGGQAPEPPPPVPPLVGPVLSRRVTEPPRYDPLRGWYPGRTPINGR